MSESRSDPGYYRTKAAHMRRLANQAQTEAARATYLLLEASWLRLAETSEKKRADDLEARPRAGTDGEGAMAWAAARPNPAGGSSGQAGE